MPGRFISWVIIWLACAGGFSNQVGAQDSIEAERNRAEDSKLLEGLRRRRLFDLAEFYCQKQLARPGLDPTSQSTLAIELMKTQTSKAILSDPG